MTCDRSEKQQGDGDLSRLFKVRRRLLLILQDVADNNRMKGIIAQSSTLMTHKVVGVRPASSGNLIHVCADRKYSSEFNYHQLAGGQKNTSWRDWDTKLLRMFGESHFLSCCNCNRCGGIFLNKDCVSREGKSL